MTPWETLATETTAEGLLELRRRGDEFLLVIDGRVLMTSAARRSEEALARLAIGRLRGQRAPRVLIGGLGMGFTLRAALDALGAGALIVVAEISPVVVAWCRGPMAPLTGRAVADPRVAVEVADVAQVIEHARPASYHAIVLDLYEGPYGATQPKDHAIFGLAALRRARAALAPGGVLSVWGEEVDPGFTRRLRSAGFASVETHRDGHGGRRHVVYLAG